MAHCDMSRRWPEKPARHASRSRLQTVLEIGIDAKGYDENGNFTKYVEFTPDDPKHMSSRTCISVPWKKYGKDVSPIIVYLQDVAADRRLKNYDFGPNWRKLVTEARSRTQDDDVQKYANDKNAVSLHFKHAGTVHWVIAFEVTDNYKRYCLKPESMQSVEERLQSAIYHMEAYMTPEAMNKRGEQTIRYYLPIFTAALRRLEANANSNKAAKH